jgi:hypothetical protein
MVHDMNMAIPENLRNMFSVVIDGGTLEHVFNFPVAIKSCMEMVQVGGHLIIMAPANNFMGHGFYQFSPELFFRVCSEENGFEVSRAILTEVDPDAQWYEITDPAKAQRRVEAAPSRPAYLLVEARKLRAAPILTTAPQQSDYSLLWQRPELAAHDHKGISPPFPVRFLRALARRIRAGYRLAEPVGLASYRLRPDPRVFKKVSWLS